MFQNKLLALRNRTAGAVICDDPTRRPKLRADSSFCFSPSSHLRIISVFFFFLSFFGLGASEDGFREGFWMLEQNWASRSV